MDYTALPPEVQTIGRLHFEGNIIPHSWYREITFENGRPDMVAITILSEAVYWYRPVLERDEETGRVIGYRKRFKGDRWQRSYESLAEQFGWSKLQVKRGCDRLRERGLIEMEFRDLRLESGIFLRNSLFIAPRPEAVAAISFRAESRQPAPSLAERPYSEVTTSLLESNHVVTLKSPHGTKTPTETPTEREGARAKIESRPLPNRTHLPLSEITGVEFPEDLPGSASVWGSEPQPRSESAPGTGTASQTAPPPDPLFAHPNGRPDPLADSLGEEPRTKKGTPLSKMILKFLNQEGFIGYDQANLRELRAAYPSWTGDDWAVALTNGHEWAEENGKLRSWPILRRACAELAAEKAEAAAKPPPRELKTKVPLAFQMPEMDFRERQRREAAEQAARTAAALARLAAERGEPGGVRA